jgi:hypothetical protein
MYVFYVIFQYSQLPVFVWNVNEVMWRPFTVCMLSIAIQLHTYIYLHFKIFLCAVDTEYETCHKHWYNKHLTTHILTIQKHAISHQTDVTNTNDTLLEQYKIQIYFYTLTCLYWCVLWDSLSQHAYPFYSLAADPDRKAFKLVFVLFVSTSLFE